MNFSRMSIKGGTNTRKNNKAFMLEEKMKKRVILVAALIASVMLTGCAKGSGARAKGSSTKTVNIAIQPSAAFLPLYVAREKGWIEEALASSQVKVNWNDFESGPPMNESLAAGTSDIGVIGDVPTVSSIAAGQKNVIVGVPANGPDAYAVLSAAGSGLRSAKDLKGKKVATVIGSTGHNLIKKILETNGLTFDDIELINIGAGDAAAVLATGQVDAVVIWEPNVTRLVDSGTARIIAKGSDTTLRGTNTFIAREAFVKSSPQVISVILEQFARAVRELPVLDEETLSKVAENLALEPEQIKKLLPKYNFAVTVDDTDADALQDTIKFLVSIDVLSEEYDVRQHIDTSFFENSDAASYLN